MSKDSVFQIQSISPLGEHSSTEKWYKTCYKNFEARIECPGCLATALKEKLMSTTKSTKGSTKKTTAKITTKKVAAKKAPAKKSSK